MAGGNMVRRSNTWVWMPHAAHLCVASRCQFRMATYIPPSLNVHDGVIVSTAGEYIPPDREKFETIGADRLYETMVFKAIPMLSGECDVCPYQCDVESGEIDFDGYNTGQDAYAGHMAFCLKWAAQEAPWI